MIVIVESGATKSDWRVLSPDGRELKRFTRGGTNVSTMHLEDIKATLADAITSETLILLIWRTSPPRRTS